MAEQMTTISVRLTEQDKETLVKIAENQDRNLSQLLRIIIRDYLKEREEK